MANEKVNKVVYDGTTLIDLTSDTVAANKLLSGYTAHDASGAQITGTYDGGTLPGTVSQDSNGYLVLDDDPPSGGALKIVTGTFTGTTTGAAMDITLDYSGNGYPIAVLIYPSGGTYNSSSTFYNLVQQYAYMSFALIKSVTNAVPDYSSTSSINNASMMGIYKSSTSSSTTYSRNYSKDTKSFNDVDAGVADVKAAIIRSKTKLSVYIPTAGSDYGFAANVEYTYHVIYSS